MVNCPCAQQSCAGNTLRNSAAIQIAKVLVSLVVIYLGVIVFLYWTPIVALGSYTWTVPWRAFLMTVTIAGQAFLCVPFVGHGLTPDPALLALDAKLDVRAIALSLAGLQAEQHAAPKKNDLSPVLPSGEPAPFSSPAYISIYETLAPKWRQRVKATETFTTVLASTLPLPIISLLLNLLGADCIPAYLITLVIFHTLELMYFALSMAVANAGVTRCANMNVKTALAIRGAFEHRCERGCGDRKSVV
jgi:hypothetical protein